MEENKKVKLTTKIIILLSVVIALISSYILIFVELPNKPLSARAPAKSRLTPKEFTTSKCRCSLIVQADQIEKSVYGFAKMAQTLRTARCISTSRTISLKYCRLSTCWLTS